MLADNPDLYLTRADKPLVFRDLDEFAPQIGKLVFMLDYARRNTLDAVTGLTQQQLDESVLAQGNSIGMLLSHIAEVETFYQALTFQGKRPPVDAAQSVLSDYGRETIKGQELRYYLDRLNAVRAETLSELRRRDERWLQQEYSPWSNQNPANNFFCWFHVLEDELSHAGQIRVLRKEIELQAL